MVLGMISEKMRIRMVVIAEMRPNHSLPKTRAVCRPTPAAPMVLAMVLSERMAAMGLSMLSLRRRNSPAFLLPSSWSIVRYDTGVDIRTDSRTEQTKEMPIAPRRKSSRRPIIMQR